MGILNVQATATLKENVRVEVEARGHRLIIDEPEALGGTDQGMNPVELLLSALGACQAIVARTYAKKFGIDLKSFRVDLEGELDIDGFPRKIRRPCRFPENHACVLLGYGCRRGKSSGVQRIP